GAPDVAELEGDQHLVVDLGDPDGATVRPGAQLSEPRPVRLVVVIQPGEFQLDPGAVVRVIVVGDQCDDDAVDGRATGRRVAVRRSQRGQAEQGAVLPAADHKVSSIAVIAEDMTCAGQRVLAGEL